MGPGRLRHHRQLPGVPGDGQHRPSGGSHDLCRVVIWLLAFVALAAVIITILVLVRKNHKRKPI